MEEEGTSHRVTEVAETHTGRAILFLWSVVSGLTYQGLVGENEQAEERKDEKDLGCRDLECPEKKRKMQLLWGLELS